MNKFNKVIDKMIEELLAQVENDENVKEFLSENYGSLLEDDRELCVIEYIALYYNAIDDIVDRNR